MKRKFLSLIVAMVMVFGIITPPRGNLAYAAGETPQLAIGDYVKTNGNLDSSTGNYQGTWTASIPLATVMSPIMPKIPDRGYPHGKEGKNTIAYIEYRVQFPENVSIGEGITTANTSNIIYGDGIKATTSGNVVTFKIPLQDVDNPSLKKNYEKDVQNDPSTKTVDLSIPYSFNTKDVPGAGNKSITSDGEIEIHPSGRLWSLRKIIFASDKATKPLATGLPAAPDPSKPIDPDQNGTPKIPLEGDILIGGETEHDKVYTTHKDATLSFTGALDVRPIKQQLANTETSHPGASGQEEAIAISGLNFSMTATFTLPKEMDFDPADVKATLTDANDKFEITDTKTEGQKVSVTMKLKDQDKEGKYKTFKDIKEAVNGTGDVLKVTLSGAKFNESSKPNTDYTVKGTIGGNFKATATMNGNAMPFNFDFVGRQSAEGRDAIIKDASDTSIQFTLNYIPEIKATLPLEGDILIGDETEHTKVYETGKNVVQKFSGTLNVVPIKKQLADIEKKYSNAAVQGSKIAISNLDFSMVATFELPKEMDFDPATVTATLDGAKDKFEITDTKTVGRKVTVTMKLKDQDQEGKYTTFEDIKTAVNGAGDVLKVTLSGAKFNKDSKPNTNYTVKGTVGGNFKATATFNDNSIDFNFIFKGLQSKDGKDFVIVDEANNTAIQFTLKYKEEKTPSTPGWTVTPINPADSKLNLVDHLAYMKGYPDLTFGPNRNMTRAEVTMMFARLLKDRPEANKVYTMPYADVTKDDWYAFAVSYMTENKLITGYPDGTFKPNNPISRAEFAAIASRFDQLKIGLSLPFNDVGAGHWAYDVIASAADKGWVNGYPDGSFKPENKITRAEVVSTTNRMLNRYADLAFAKAHKTELAPMRDMDESHWAYGAAVEAMNGHDYHRQADGKNETWILLNGKRFTFPMAPTGIPN
ncbi:S-layer homology domain-containing protein [Aedoeadaptatus coli]|uniref:S-layer homology domain-containing protein n=1 Tax=Aedoeadaptatus coli TaxID=2058292 RepID=UPI000D54F5EB|nr:S-layer homology domain-containing protein [Peptoniphilus coli]